MDPPTQTPSLPAAADALATESLAECLRRSSFGEYNPGGGKEQIRKYLLLCQEQVIKSKASLETIVKILKV